MARYISTMRAAYANQLLANKDYVRAEEVATAENIYTPILKIREAHPDAEPDPKAHNEILQDLIYDMSIIKMELCTTSYDFKALLESSIERISAVKKTLTYEKERLQDINILCNKFTEFSHVLNLNGDDFSGSFTETDGVFSAKVVSESPVVISIPSIEGNGYEGNNYVYADSKFTIDVMDTSNRKYLIDTTSTPYYEYSRITANNTETEIFPAVNFDSLEAKCVVSVNATKKFNKLIITSPQPGLVLADIAISSDGMIFQSIQKQSIDFNDTDQRYEMQDYIPGSGIICFPETYYAKVTLESRGTTDDAIAFYKTEII